MFHFKHCTFARIQTSELGYTHTNILDILDPENRRVDG